MFTQCFTKILFNFVFFEKFCSKFCFKCFALKYLKTFEGLAYGNLTHAQLFFYASNLDICGSGADKEHSHPFVRVNS